MTTSKKVPCPQCGELQVWNNDNTFRPFCSESCKNTDFLAWANEEQKIEERNEYSDLMSEDPTNQLQ